jgi:hypothetical protein
MLHVRHVGKLARLMPDKLLPTVFVWTSSVSLYLAVADQAPEDVEQEQQEQFFEHVLQSGQSMEVEALGGDAVESAEITTDASVSSLCTWKTLPATSRLAMCMSEEFSQWYVASLRVVTVWKQQHPLLRSPHISLASIMCWDSFMTKCRRYSSPTLPSNNMPWPAS